MVSADMRLAAVSNDSRVRRHLRDGPLSDLDERVGQPVQLVDVVTVQIGDREQVLHLTISPRSTPSAVTLTTSSRRVGRFFPT
jgi:hypothetical protein